jgi:hypothetical protein
MKDNRCVRSGYCCKQSACQWGTWDEEAHQCIHLQGDRPGEYACGRYDEIKQAEEGWKFPMFGGGCVSTLANPDRHEVLLQLKAAS